MRNRTKQKLMEGKAVVGSAVQLNNLFALEAMGNAGFDFIMIDTQHSPIGPETLHSLVKGLSPTESDIIVRALWNDTWLINQCVDLGADGVIIPLTNTAEDTERAVAAAKYPPEGTRSYGPRVTARYGGQDEYWKRANEELLVLPQIETLEAVENIDEILQVKGIDGIMVGPSDLTLTIGASLPLMHPDTEEMIGKILSKCLEHKVPWGMFTGTFERAEQWLSRGGKIAIVGGDLSFVTEGAAKTARDAKDLLSRVNKE